MRRRLRHVALWTAAAAGYWLLDAALDSVIFRQGTFADLLILDVPPRMLLSRAVASALLVALGLGFSAVVARTRRIRQWGARASRAVQILAACNQAMLRATDEPSMLEEICRLTSGLGGFPMVWVGLARDDAEQSVEVAALAAPKGRLPEAPRLSWGPGPRGRGPTGSAIRQGKPHLVRDALTDPDCAPWADDIRRCRCRSCLALPLRVEGTVVGALSIAATDRDAFDPIDVQLLGELANDIAVGLASLRAARRREQAERDLQQQQAQLRLVTDSLPALIAYIDTTQRYRMANAAYQGWFGLRNEQVVGAHIRQVIGEAAYTQVRPYVEAALRGEMAQFDAVYPGPAGPRSVHVTYVPSRSAEGAVEGFFLLVQDISARAAGEQALRESEERYRKLVATANDAIFIADSETGRIVDCNLAAEALMRMPRDQIIGRHQASLHPPEQSDYYHRVFASHVRKGGVTEEEALVQRPDGSRRSVTISASVVEAGGHRLIQGIFHDITDRLAAERDLRESQRAIATLLSNLPGMAYRCLGDEARTMQFVSEGAMALTGYRPGELQGPDAVRWGELVHPDDVPGLRQEVDGALRTAQPFEVTYRIRTAGGQEKWVWEQGRGVFSTDQRLEAIEGFITDITEPRQAQEELRRQRDLANGLIDTAEAIIVVLDLQGRVVRLNAFGQRLLGRSEEELRGADWMETCVPADLREEIRGVFADIMSRQESRSFVHENPVLDAQGRQPLVRWTASFLRGPGGEKAGLLAIGQDVTELRQKEEQLQQAAKMEAVGRLAGGIAHDFNNMLAIILGYAELLLRTTPAGDGRREDIERIYDAARRSAALVAQLLTFSRKQLTQPRPVDLNEVVAGMEPLLRRTIGEDIALDVAPGEGLWTARVDPTQMEQVLLNLVVNARQAMPQGGRMTIETRNVELDEAYAERHAQVGPGQYVLLAVSDTGVGMTEEVKQHIFEPFFTTRGRGEGTGLGLATSYAVVKNAGGHIWVYSEVGKGTTFRIYLPRAAEPAGEGTGEAAPRVLAQAAPAATPDAAASPGPVIAASAPPPPPPAGSILLVEDEPAVRALAARVLRDQGYAVLEAGDAQEALAMLAGQPQANVRLLVTDVVMPGLSGDELARRVQADCPDVRVLFITGYADRAAVGHGLLAPDADFITKPFSPIRLTQAVRRAMGLA